VLLDQLAILVDQELPDLWAFSLLRQDLRAQQVLLELQDLKVHRVTLFPGHQGQTLKFLDQLDQLVPQVLLVKVFMALPDLRGLLDLGELQAQQVLEVLEA
jgi:hypothetical protein